MPAFDPSVDTILSTLLTKIADDQGADEVARLLAAVLPRLCETPVQYERYFALWEEHGVHVTPVHFYQPIPDTRTLHNHEWHKSHVPGIDWNESRQLELLREFSKFHAEFDEFPIEPTGVASDFHMNQGLFDGTDALVLYCMIRRFQPSMILEVGSGMSSLLSAQAARKNGHTKLVCIEPYPNEILRDGISPSTVLRIEKVQDVSVTTFQELGENDILFIDSSHVVRIGGDVNYLFLEVLPRLRPGVIVHVHDIFLPSEYPQHWVLKARRFWTEQYLLQAFLCHNPKFEVLFANNYMGEKHRDTFKEVFPNSPWWGGGSFWIRRKLDV